MSNHRSAGRTWATRSHSVRTRRLGVAILVTGVVGMGLTAVVTARHANADHGSLREAANTYVQGANDRDWATVASFDPDCAAPSVKTMRDATIAAAGSTFSLADAIEVSNGRAGLVTIAVTGGQLDGVAQDSTWQNDGRSWAMLADGSC